MPTREAIVNTVIPNDAPKPIPVRTVTTRSKPRPELSINPQNSNQPDTSVNNPGAELPATEESVRLSPQLSALARKEQAFRQREQALKQREADLEAKLAKADQFDSLSQKFSQKDFSEAEKLGLNYEEYTKFLLDKQAGEDPTSQKFKELEEKIASMTKQQEERAEAEYKDTVAAYSREIGSAVETNPDFSSIKTMKAQEHVLQLILDTWEEDQQEMTVAEACKLIEDKIVEQGKLFSGLPKLKPAVEEPATQKLPPPRPGVSTLTNNMAPTGAEKRALPSLQHMSESERYAEARRRVLAKRQQQG